MNFVGSQKNIYNMILVIGVFAVICLITLVLFIFGKKIAERINPAFLKVTSRIMGLILAVIATQMLINGISGAYHLIQINQL
jgi:multiple antibiotic resistance protein